MEPNIISIDGMGIFKTNDKNNENNPATNPLIITIENGSFPEIFLMKLLSIPQQKHAAIIP